MQQLPDGRQGLNCDPEDVNMYIDGSQAWWHDFRQNAKSSNILPKNTLYTTSMQEVSSSCLGIKEHDRGHNAHIETINFGLPNSDKICRMEHETMSVGEHLRAKTQRDYIGYSLASPTYSCSEPYFRDGTSVTDQTLVRPSPQTMHHDRVVLPFISEEPVYVNPKQYNGILRRRQLRAKAELENRVTRVRKPYLHESRHLHAMRRARGCGGRFANTKKPDTVANNDINEKGNSSGNSGFTKAPFQLGSESGEMISSKQVESSTNYDEQNRQSNQESRSTEFLQCTLYHNWLSK